MFKFQNPTTYKKALSGFFLLCLLAYSTTYAQSVINSVPSASYENIEDTYNYTYWDNNFKTTGIATKEFTNQTNDYLLKINYTNLNISSLNINNSGENPTEAFATSSDQAFTDLRPGTIDYKILQNGNVQYAKPNTNPTNLGAKISQTAEFGTWINRRVVDNLNYTNNPPLSGSYSGIEFTNWHNRFKITFHVRPTTTITNGQIQLSVQIPTAYATKLQSGDIYGFTDGSGSGFSVKGGSSAATTTIAGNVLTVTTAQRNLSANTSYQVSIIFFAVKSNFATTYANMDMEATNGVSITANQTLPSAATPLVQYIADEGYYLINKSAINMGQYNCSTQEVMQNIKLQLQNTSSTDKRIRLCFYETPSANVTGFSTIITNNNDDPSGLPVQVSKNWHGSAVNAALYFGNWVKEYTEFIIPAQTTLMCNYNKVGAKWGETFSASSHQLSVVGASNSRSGWLQAAIGSFGENITHSPDYEYGNINAPDVRPFLTTNRQHAPSNFSQQCSWTGNVGGFDMMNYKTSSSKVYPSQVRTRFQRYSPNLTETSVSSYSSDGNLKLDYTFYLNRSDDINRVYYKIKVKVLNATSFSSFDIFQLGGDTYRNYYANALAYGNDEGLVATINPTYFSTATNNYTTNAIPLTGANQWVWAGDGERTDNNYSSSFGTKTNNGFIIRDYKATFGGTTNNTPYFKERASTRNSAATGRFPTSYCVVPPPSVTSFSAGDEIELLVEAVVLPKLSGDYYGPNKNFEAAMDSAPNNGNSWEILLREAAKNSIDASSATNQINTTYPLTVTTIGNEAKVTINKGLGYTPIVFSGLTSVSNPQLWVGGDGCWELVDQSTYGKDFWQANYIPETGTFDLVFNVNRDTPNDVSESKQYYLGNTPSGLRPEIAVQSKLNDNDYTTENNLNVSIGYSVILAPQIDDNGTITDGDDNNWIWTGPNGFSQTGRVVTLNNIDTTNYGEYEVTYNGLCTLNAAYSLEKIVFIPDPNKKYYIDNPNSNLRLAATGESEDPYTASTTTTGADVEWKFVDKGNGYWHVDRAAGGTTPRLRTDRTENADMDAITSNGSFTYYEFEQGSTEGLYFMTLPEAPQLYSRLRLNSSGQFKMVSKLTNSSPLELFTFTEVNGTLGTDEVDLNKPSGLIVYPNPTNGLITVANLNPSISIPIKVVDIQGKVVFIQNSNKASEASLDLGNLTHGIYFLIAGTDHKKIIIK